MKNLITLLFLCSCATRGLRLPDQIASLHPEFENPNVIGFIETGVEIKQENFQYVAKGQNDFLKKYFSKSNRSIATINDYNKEFQFVDLTINPGKSGLLLND